MSGRLDKERQAAEEPRRIEYAKAELQKLGYEITFECDTRIEFIFRGETVKLFPYSGWFTGKSIKDGRGIQNLLTQLK